MYRQGITLSPNGAMAGCRLAFVETTKNRCFQDILARLLTRMHSSDFPWPAPDRFWRASFGDTDAHITVTVHLKRKKRKKKSQEKKRKETKKVSAVDTHTHIPRKRKNAQNRDLRWWSHAPDVHHVVPGSVRKSKKNEKTKSQECTAKNESPSPPPKEKEDQHTHE